MRDIFVLTERDLRASVRLDRAAIDIVEQAFRALASGKVIMPPILSMDIPDAHGEVDVKTAYIPGFDGFAIKVSPGFFDNPKIGLPSINGLMILLASSIVRGFEVRGFFPAFWGAVVLALLGIVIRWVIRSGH